jgi:hypothetical protein
LSYNWIISIWALQLAILTTGFWHKVIDEEESLESRI